MVVQYWRTKDSTYILLSLTANSLMQCIYDLAKLVAYRKTAAADEETLLLGMEVDGAIDLQN